MTKKASASKANVKALAKEVSRQFAEGLLPSTVERRLLREGYPEADVRRLVEAERQRIEEQRRKARSQAALNNAKIVGLVLVGLGLLLPWSVASAGDLGLGGTSSQVANGFSPAYFVYGLVFLALSVILLVLLLLTRTHYDADNPRDRVIFGLTTLVEALMAGWWVLALVAVNRELAAAREANALLGDLAAITGAAARFGIGLFGIPIGLVTLLVTGYMEVVVLGGAPTLRLTQTENPSTE